MKKFKTGQRVKLIGENRIFTIYGFTKGRRSLPDGWLIDEDGCAVNPKFCRETNS